MLTQAPLRPTTTVPLARAASASRRRVKVCHLSMTLQMGGLERLLVDFGRLHDAARFELRFVAVDLLGAPAEELRTMGFDVDSLQFSAVGKLRMLRNLVSLLKREQIDVLHTHNTYPHFYGTLAARLAGVPIVVNTQHGRGCGNGWKDRLQFRLANRLSEQVVGVSEDATRLCRDQDWRSAGRISCIWNGIDLERFAVRPLPAVPHAISVARLSKEKDFGTLLRAVALARAEVPEFRLTIVGDGAERASLEQLTDELGLRDVVTFLGERRDIPELLSQASFFVSSSKTEGISLTLLEAMAVGLPILTTRVGGNPEVVQEGVTGRLVEPLNPDALASGIVEMCRDRQTREQMGKAGRERVEEHFNVRRMIGRYEELYLAHLGSEWQERSNTGSLHS